MFNIQTKNQFDDLFEEVHSVNVSDVRRAMMKDMISPSQSVWARCPCSHDPQPSGYLKHTHRIYKDGFYLRSSDLRDTDQPVCSYDRNCDDQNLIHQHQSVILVM